MEGLERIAGDFYRSNATRGISVSPEDVIVDEGALFGKLGKRGYVDICSRLGIFAKGKNEWVGVSYDLIERRVELECSSMEGALRMYDHKIENSTLFRFFRVLSRLLGVEHQRKGLPYEDRLLLFQGYRDPRTLKSDIEEMADAGYVEIVEQDGRTILLPTQKMVDCYPSKDRTAPVMKVADFILI